ncbi:hypothetical protein AM493_11140 [Flavobacterium akiainvivens]|uniref:Uncharacterized protein n=1 Tax=Flavobacterium akiainvivens TaxID=1202724 RepID=A0A0M9VID5_9FLAO|nr:hypothetical protein [Flavobacterium akiainvivens]KOS06526.1 hypothetical protein AM493_11140 [Flavobacterium akiainvivens]SFQ11405.1 hypothetical protein SAMN05444144_101131 [Flavobacterium akiainvivens]
MEPNKIEQEIREKLEGRTITPSPMAWDRLDAMLTVAEGNAQKPTKKRGFGWLYMAACFLLMLGVGGYFMLHNSSDSIEADPTKSVVNSNTNTTQTGGHTNTGAIISPETQIQGHNTNTTQAVAGVQQGSSSSKNNQSQQQQQGTTSQDNPGLAPAETAQPQMLALNKPDSKIKVDANALLASVQNQKPQAAKATQPKVKVNANELLTGIEGEMEMNFRDRMFNRLAKGYDEVKEAVVTRNYN